MSYKTRSNYYLVAYFSIFLVAFLNCADARRHSAVNDGGEPIRKFEIPADNLMPESQPEEDEPVILKWKTGTSQDVGEEPIRDIEIPDETNHYMPMSESDEIEPSTYLTWELDVEPTDNKDPVVDVPSATYQAWQPNKSGDEQIGSSSVNPVVIHKWEPVLEPTVKK